ncbi:MAG TPA: Bax inhibitor-1/YccA family protein [Nocardioidaceae bacterium]|nr:Bax inhibitor-1/YccA family protein [Nocardioidaceae bacterium]
MQSNNPVFRNSDAFNGRSTYGSPSGYTDPSTWSTGSGTGAPPTVEERITIDSVVQKTAITLGVIVVAAMVTWVLSGDLSADENLGQLAALAGVAALIAFGLSMVNSFKRVISPALVLLFAAAEGVALGGISKMFEAWYDGVVSGAILGTIAAFGGTLAAYKIFNIKVTSKFRRGVIAAMFGFIGVAILDSVLSLFDLDFGFNGFGTLGLLASIGGLVLGVLMLILDFDFVEQAIRVGAPERESWRAAFALSVSLIWIYTNLLRILAIIQGE